MSFQIPTYDDPHSTQPISNAYAWITFLACDFLRNSGNFVLPVWFDEASYAAGKPPVDTVAIQLGQMVKPAVPATDTQPAQPEVKISTLQELLSDTTFAAAFNTIASILYTEARKLDRFSASIDVT